MQTRSDLKELLQERLANEIKSLAMLLDKHYTDKTSFRNHCYLRIAYDNTCSDKWDNVVEKPFIKNASLPQLVSSLKNLKKYQQDFEVLVSDNKKSLNFRQKTKLWKQ